MKPRRLSLFLALCLLPLALLAQSHTSLITAFVPDEQALTALARAGVDLSETRGKPGGWMEFAVPARLLTRLAQTGLPYRILEENMEESYAASVRNLGPYDALGFGTGSMGGHYTYWEVARQLDTMKLLYPALITVKQVIGTTIKGRAIWAVKISDNPDLQENEPEVLYTGLIHAREPAGMMSVIYYMWHLLENYGTDPEATFLVNNRQMWFVPVVNADGYEYNRKFYPSGGGMHRKNCRNVDTMSYGSVYGIDLNRNFGTHEMWNSPYGGSSTDPTDDTYRGTIEWSEPETAALRDLSYAHAFRTALNYHTYGDYLIYPWGYQPFESPDSLLFREFSADMVRFNGYLAGRSTTTVGYTVRGCSDDFFYGDSAKPKVFSWTPEVGDRFWALPQDILPFARENLGPNLYVARIAGSYVLPVGRTIADANGNGFVERGEAFTLTAVLRNKGLSGADNVTAALTSGTPWISVTGQPVTIEALASQASAPAPFQAAVAANSPTGVPASLFLTTTDASGSVAVDTIRLMIGTPSASFTDSAATIANWTPQSPWGLTATHHSPPSSFTDSPSGNYAAGIDKSLTLTNGINLTGATSATLNFWARWDIEANWDFARVEVSTNNGSTWGSLRGRYTRLGSGDHPAQPDTAYGYDGTRTTWLEEEMDLAAYVGRVIKLRFRLTSDGSLQKDGFYVDDIRLVAYTPSFDTGLVVTPATITLNGLTGSRTDRPVVIRNFTGSAVIVAVSESLGVGPPAPDHPAGGARPDFAPFLGRLRGLSPVRTEEAAGPLEFLTAATDQRGDNLLDGIDLLDIQYQRRTTILGPVLDLRMRILCPDSNFAGFLSLDTDQDFITGVWPAPWGLGLRGRDLGAEFEVLVDASGFLADSLGLGPLPVAAIFRTADTSLVFVPLVPAITRDSVLTITVSGIPFGALGLNDTDEHLNIGAAFARLTASSFFPDFAPNTGHGLIGAESGVSWISESARLVTIPAGDSAAVTVSVLAAKPAGAYTARVVFSPAGRTPVTLPVTMQVTGLGNATLTVSPEALTDTLSPGATAAHTVTLGNTGSVELFWGAVDTAATTWLSVDPPAGVIPPGSEVTISVLLNAGSLPPSSTWHAQVGLVSNDVAQPSRPFPVTLVVDAGTSAGDDGSVIPDRYRLWQNYPNPFNPATSIRVDLSQGGPVSLVLYDLLGREVRRLAEGVYPAGVHIVRLDAGDLPSGIYVYRLRSGAFSGSRRLVLVK